MDLNGKTTEKTRRYWKERSDGTKANSDEPWPILALGQRLAGVASVPRLTLQHQVHPPTSVIPTAKAGAMAAPEIHRLRALMAGPEPMPIPMKASWIPPCSPWVSLPFMA
jgi:hypothetical protein